MLENIAFGALLTVCTAIVHALCTAGLIGFLRATKASRWALRNAWRRVSVISGLALAMVLVSVFEASMWAVVYVRRGAIESFEEALYFSVVTFTTLGYGDITLGEDWRLLASIQAADGAIMFGWTTALIVAVGHRMILAEDQ